MGPAKERLAHVVRQPEAQAGGGDRETKRNESEESDYEKFNPEVVAFPIQTWPWLQLRSHFVWRSNVCVSVSDLKWSRELSAKRERGLGGRREREIRC